MDFLINPQNSTLHNSFYKLVDPRTSFSDSGSSESILYKSRSLPVIHYLIDRDFSGKMYGLNTSPEMFVSSKCRGELSFPLIIGPEYLLLLLRVFYINAPEYQSSIVLVLTLAPSPVRSTPSFT